MKKKTTNKIILSIISCMAVLITGCSKYTPSITGSDGGKTKYQDVPTEVIELSITHYSDTPPITYIFVKEDDQYLLKIDKYEKEDSESYIIDIDIFNRVNEWVDIYNIRSWDGFDKVNKDILDGGGFRLSIQLGTGETITAHGSNEYPEEYGNANRVLNDIIDEITNNR